MPRPRPARRTPPVCTLAGAPLCRRRLSWPAALAGLLIAAHTTPSWAALRQWTGAGTGPPNWSDPANWTGGVPVDGDALLFGAFSLDLLHRTTRDDVSPLDLDLIAFTADAAPYSINVFEKLTISGAGILNASPNTHTLLIGNTRVGLDERVANFANSATAGNLRIETEGTLKPSATSQFFLDQPGRLRFLNASSAATATILNGGGAIAGGDGGLTDFANTSTAAGASITNVGGTSSGVVGGFGGFTRFSGTSTGGSATIANHGGTAAGTGGGTTDFNSSSTAATARITNGQGSSGGPGGVTNFFGTATAADAIVINVGGTSSSLAGSGSTVFTVQSTAGRATITNNAGTANGAEGGLTAFSGGAVAGTATITNNAGTAVGAQGGLTRFGGEGAGQICSADAARITNDGGSVPNLSGVFAGRTFFEFNATAGNATIVNRGGSTNLGIGGRTDFDRSTAGAANITNQPGLVSGARGGWTAFADSSTAGNATITNEAAPVIGASPGFTSFVDAYTLAATLINRGSAVSGANAGRTDFSGTSIAGNPTIANEAGTANGTRGGRTIFRESATAGNANIVNNGAPVAGAEAGATEFSGTASAGNSTITNGTGAAGAAGGLTLFLGGAGGGTARAITNGAGRFDISGLTTAGTAVGSIEGSGNYLLGGKNLAVGGNGLSTTMTGTLQDGGASGGVAGSLTKVGPGTLTLSGNNTYTGSTNVTAGTLRVARLHANPVAITGGKLQVLESSPTLPAHPAGNNASVCRPSALTIANDGAALGTRAYAGQLDLGNNDLILGYKGASPLAEIEDMIRSGYSGGTWLGNGITSSTANANRNFALAVADNERLTIPFGRGRLFSGQEVGASAILVKFTHRIDLDLDGVITTNDATIFNSNYNEGAAAYWSIGDVDYDRVFTSNDATLFNSFYSEALASVPEPASIGVLALAGASLLGRRRRVVNARRSGERSWCSRA